MTYSRGRGPLHERDSILRITRQTKNVRNNRLIECINNNILS